MFFGFKLSTSMVLFTTLPWSVSFLMIGVFYLNVFFFFYQKFLFVFFHYLSNQFLFFNISSNLWFLINLY